MRSWKNIPVPLLMADLEKDRRGFPVPHIVMRDKEGVPHFKLNNEILVEACIADRRCSICGKHLYSDMWMIGGPLSAFHPQGAFVDIPIHKECGEYALQVCPYLAVSNYSRKTNLDDFDDTKFDGVGFRDPTQSEDRVPFFAFIKISDYTVKRRPPIHRFIYPVKPYLEIEMWNDGRQITPDEAKLLIEKKHNMQDIHKFHKEMMEKYGWYMHYVPSGDDTPFGVNIHTHGLTVTYGHKDIQICFPLPQKVAHAIMNNIVHFIEKGAKFEPGKMYPDIANYSVQFIDAWEQQREVLRLIVPDKYGMFDTEPYKQQFENILHNLKPKGEA